MEKNVNLSEDRLGPHRDEFYQALLDAHDGLSFEQSVRLNARLILLLANQVGDIRVLKAALSTARKSAR